MKKVMFMTILTVVSIKLFASDQSLNKLFGLNQPSKKNNQTRYSAQRKERINACEKLGDYLKDAGWRGSKKFTRFDTKKPSR